MVKYKILTSLFPLLYLTGCGDNNSMNIQKDYLGQAEVIVKDTPEPIISENNDGYMPSAIGSKEKDVISIHDAACIKIGLRMILPEPNEPQDIFEKKIKRICTDDSLEYIVK